VGISNFPLMGVIPSFAPYRKQTIFFGASDASYKEGNRSTHAWILSTGTVSDITNPLLNIHGTGPVHGQKNLGPQCKIYNPRNFPGMRFITFGTIEWQAKLGNPISYLWRTLWYM